MLFINHVCLFLERHDTSIPYPGYLNFNLHAMQTQRFPIFLNLSLFPGPETAFVGYILALCILHAFRLTVQTNIPFVIMPE
jgi:hypothetical protein